MSLLLLPAIPLLAALASLAPLGRRAAPALTLTASLLDLGLALGAAGQVAPSGRAVAIPGWAEIDGLSAVLLLLTTFVATLAALASWGYVLAHESEPGPVRRYFAHFNLFQFALVSVPLAAEPAVVWIAIEFTAVFSVLLVAYEGTRPALEAAWKYIALMFMGAAIALLGFLVLFWAQRQAGGGPFSWEGLRATAPHMAPVLVRSAFVLVLVGFGTKVGLVPFHTWLPDAHSQAPSPVCALLSGVKTTAALYAVIRLVPLLPALPTGIWLRLIGLLSVAVAVLLILQVRDYKRLFAYSTVEHMGIVMVGVGIGGPAGSYAAALQIVSHGLTKAFCFFAAGAALTVLGSREIGAGRGLIRSQPVVGAALLFGALAIGGAPPFAVFLSEFSILRAGVAAGYYATVAALALGIVVAFFGILRHMNRMAFGPPDPAPAAPVHLPASLTATLAAAAVPIVLLGVLQPAPFTRLLALAASALTPAAGP